MNTIVKLFSDPNLLYENRNTRSLSAFLKRLNYEKNTRFQCNLIRYLPTYEGILQDIPTRSGDGGGGAVKHIVLFLTGFWSVFRSPNNLNMIRAHVFLNTSTK